jgi:transposase-like protein
MRELSVSEQRYQAVLAVIKDGETVVSVAAGYGVSRKAVHQWLSRYEADGLEKLADRSRRPTSSPLQMPLDQHSNGCRVCLRARSCDGVVREHH